jgi:single-stranded DNA-binding protein
MKSTIQCAFLAIAETAEIRKSKRGSDYLSLTVKQLSGGEDAEAIWVTAWHDHHVEEVSAAVKPGSTVYIEGIIKLKRWESQGIAHAMLSVVAEKVEVLFGIDARPKARGAGKPAAAKTDAKIAAAAAVLEPQSTPALPIASDDGLEFATGLYQRAAATRSGKVYEGDIWQDQIPF